MPSAYQTIATVILPNVMKLKGAATVMSAMERRDGAIFAHVWEQTGVTHTPTLAAKDRGTWRFGILTMPAPKEMGDPHMVAFVTKTNDAAFARYFMLDHDYVLATKQNRTVLSEREGNRTTKHGDGPAMSGDFQTDANAFVDAIVAVLEPRKK